MYFIIINSGIINENIRLDSFLLKINESFPKEMHLSRIKIQKLILSHAILNLKSNLIITDKNFKVKNNYHFLINLTQFIDKQFINKHVNTNNLNYINNNINNESLIFSEQSLPQDSDSNKLINIDDKKYLNIKNLDAKDANKEYIKAEDVKQKETNAKSENAYNIENINNQNTKKGNSNPNIEKQGNNIEIEIIYEDDDLLVINKPINLITHQAANPHSNTIVKILFTKLKSFQNENLRPGIVHRLDKDTSGLMVIAKNEISLMNLSSQMKLRQIKRVYHAIVFGVPHKLVGIISTKIDRDPINRLKMKVSNYKGKDAITHYKVLKIFPKYNMSLIECALETGRTHQIRVHLSHIGHSVVGDQVYGKNLMKLKQIEKTKKTSNLINLDQINNINIGHIRHIDDNVDINNANFFAKEFNIKDFNRQALHAVRLELFHPRTNILLQFTSKFPDDIEQLIKFIS